MATGKYMAMGTVPMPERVADALVRISETHNDV